MQRRNKSNDKKELVLLQTLAANGGQVLKACEAASLSFTTYYDWRRADPEFAARADAAIDQSTPVLEQEAVRRALAGSDTMLIFLLKARVPERYRDRQDVRISLADASADQIRAALDKLDESQLRAIIAKHGSGADGASNAG